jgi:iron complex transport system ATP-binding protein
MVQVTLQDVNYSYGRKQVLHGVSHVFQPGTFTAIMGKNGSGKTTMLRCINKMAANFKGHIAIGDADVRTLSLEDLAKLSAFVPQGQDTVYGASVFETVLLGRLPYMTWAPTATDYQIVDETLEALRLRHFSATDIHRISGGERQKVYIARAIAQKTPVILLDEPVTYLDMKHQLEIMSLLENLAQQGYTIIMVVHDLNLALQFCSHFVFIKDGRLIPAGRPESVDEALVREVFEVEVEKMAHKNGRSFFSISRNNDDR